MVHSHQPFTRDIKKHGGFRYTVKAPLSSLLANDRISREVAKNIPHTVRSIIDIGCGDGTYTSEFQNVVPHARVEGYDPSKNAIKRAQYKFNNIGFSVGSIYSKPKKVYDVGVVRGVIHHLESPLRALRVMKGTAQKFIIVEPNGNNPVLKYIEKLNLPP